MLMDSVPLPAGSDDSDALLRGVAHGDDVAVWALLDRHRARLNRMVALRLDPRLSARLDASDIVQEALADAARKLTDYARRRPLPFYPWLYRLASERLAQAYRRHRQAEARSVCREEVATEDEPGGPACGLADRLADNENTPGQALLREEQRDRLHAALARLEPKDSEILVMRYIDGLTFPEICSVLGVGESAVKMRHLRALRRLRALVGLDESDTNPCP
jgi:RNA polymerase sigma-70 factor (ECF subfamily)